MADPLEHATGIEKREMLAELAGNDVRANLAIFATLFDLEFAKYFGGGSAKIVLFMAICNFWVNFNFFCDINWNLK